MKIIELLKYIFLSIIQGVGEILPISSSGHLFLLRKVLKVDISGVTFEIVLHLASLIALFIYYRKTIFDLTKGFMLYTLKKDNRFIKEYKFVIGMIMCLIPTCVVGYFVNDYLDCFLNYSFIIGLFLIFNGFNLLLIRNSIGNKNIEELSLLSFFKIGLGQCLGLIPGFSRSGSALSMCYREKLNKEDSEKLAFLMLFPLVLGSMALNIGDFSFDSNNSVLMAISFIVTFVATFLSLGLLSKIVRRGKLYYFSYYCIIIGVLAIILN